MKNAKINDQKTLFVVNIKSGCFCGKVKIFLGQFLHITANKDIKQKNKD